MEKYKEENIVGVRFGRLLAMPENDGRSPSIRKYRCVCDCGNVRYVAACSLVSGVTRSCGCLHKEIVTVHGHSCDGKMSPTYDSWVSMISRCTCPTNAAYAYYGGNGVTVCDRWLNSFTDFLEDMGERPTGRTLDRVNGAKLYSKETCKWATKREQVENRINTIYVWYMGVRMPLMRAAELSGILYVTLRGRFVRGLRGAALFSTHNLIRRLTPKSSNCETQT